MSLQSNRLGNYDENQINRPLARYDHAAQQLGNMKTLALAKTMALSNNVGRTAVAEETGVVNAPSFGAVEGACVVEATESV